MFSNTRFLKNKNFLNKNTKNFALKDGHGLESNRSKIPKFQLLK